MPPSQCTQIVFAERPKGDINSNTFRTEVVPFDAKLGDGDVLVQVTYISLDPAMRGWLDDRRGYMKPVQIGEVMKAGGLGVVVQSGRGSEYSPGDLVSGFLGMYTHTIFLLYTFILC